jgi:hypothetical protein
LKNQYPAEFFFLKITSQMEIILLVSFPDFLLDTGVFQRILGVPPFASQNSDTFKMGYFLGIFFQNDDL